jgi:hypothetical protein
MAVDRELREALIATEQLECKLARLTRRAKASQTRLKEIYIRRARMKERSPGLRVSGATSYSFFSSLPSHLLCMCAHVSRSNLLLIQEAVMRVEQGAVLAEPLLPVDEYVVRLCLGSDSGSFVIYLARAYVRPALIVGALLRLNPSRGTSREDRHII